VSHARKLRGLGAEGDARTTRGRFGRKYGFLPLHYPDDDEIKALIRAMVSEHAGDNDSIPAGFTYLGQFIDHDITFDPTSQLDRLNDPHALVNFRTPRLDLDSLYGSGPSDQPYLYERDRVKLLIGGDRQLPDLPRNRRGRAVIGDPRNDEHLIIAQLHLLFMQFHNKLVQRLSKQFAGDELLREAQRTVRWHYQWIVLHDYLRHVLGEDLAQDVRRERRFYDWDTQPFIPVEFSAGAFRFAHSMIRSDYQVRDPGDTKQILAEPRTLDDTKHLSGHRPLRPELEIDWSLFFALDERKPQPSRNIDRQLSNVLKQLPTPVNLDRVGLIELDVRRGRALGLPSGHDVARAMGAPVLTDADCPLPPPLKHAPLWYYVLCEAESALGAGGKRLGPVGGRIVGEVLVGLVEGDASSYLRQWPAWTPCLRSETPGDFTMADLIRFVKS
jgi:hypothetical protein